MAKLIVVTGATGQQGGSVVEWLLKEPLGEFTIRAVSRNPLSDASKALIAKGVEVVKADMSSLEDLTSAFRGAWGIFGVTQFYEHGYEGEQLHGRHIVEAAKAVGAKHIVWSSVEGREGGCRAISWTSKALIEDQIIASGIPYTFTYTPMYYENFFTSFFAPTYDESKGFCWSIAFLPDVPIFAFSVSDLGAWVVPALKHPDRYMGKTLKLAVEFLSLRDIVTQFSEVTGEKACLAPEMTPEQFEASRYADHPAAEIMYLSWEFVIRAGPDSGWRDKDATLAIHPAAKTYREWLNDNALVKELVTQLKTAKTKVATSRS